MLKVQFNHKITQRYADLQVGDIFMILDDQNDRCIFICTNYSGECVNLIEGNVYSFPADTPVVILKNTKLIVED